MRKHLCEANWRSGSVGVALREDNPGTVGSAEGAGEGETDTKTVVTEPPVIVELQAFTTALCLGV